MHIIICGAGEVGKHTAEVLTEQGHHITMIDVNAASLRQFSETVDIRTVVGSATHAEALRDADVSACDLLVAATNQDEVNLLCAALAKKMGVRQVVARVHHRAYVNRTPFDYGYRLGVDHLICPEYLTAMLIARQLRHPGAIAIERFAGGEIEMQQFAVTENAMATGVKLMDLTFPAGVRLATIERDGETSMPRGTSVLEVGDVVTVIGDTKQADKVRKIFHEEKRSVKNIVMMGGSSLAVWLSRALGRQGFSIRLFETNRERAEELSEKLDGVTVIQADPASPEVFQEERLETCHAFAAVSTDDEHNILAALQAKELGVQTTIVVTAQTTYLKMLSRLGIAYPYSPRIVAAREIFRLVDTSPVRRLATLVEGKIEVYELDPADDGSAVGKPLKQVKLPEGAMVAAIQRDHHVQVPGGEDQVEKGDVLIVIGPTGVEKKLRTLFLKK